MTNSTLRALRGLPPESFAFEFRFLIHVAGLERARLLGWGAVDVSVNADRAAMDDATNTLGRGGFE